MRSNSEGPRSPENNSPEEALLVLRNFLFAVLRGQGHMNAQEAPQILIEIHKLRGKVPHNDWRDLYNSYRAAKELFEGG